MTKLQIKRTHPDAVLPSKSYIGDAGFDLVATSRCVIAPGFAVVVPTGLEVALPENLFGLLLLRSGLGFKHFLQLHPGVIDSGYRGNLDVLIFNAGFRSPQRALDAPYVVEKGDRVAQLLLLPVADVEVCEVETLPSSQRGKRGFGSSGK